MLHDARGAVVRRWAVKAWLSCELHVERTRKRQLDDNRAFNGRKRVVFAPRRYSELFFLDDAVALAAGHRPCMTCRRQRAVAFRDALGGGTLKGIDEALHAERTAKEPHPLPTPLAALPDGCFVRRADGDAWLLWRRTLWRWSHEGYAEPGVPLSEATDEELSLLTPPTAVRALVNGFDVGRVALDLRDEGT